MRGRKPKPTRQKKLEGNPGKRKLPAAEPVLPPLAAGAPAELEGDAAALREWARLDGMLRSSRVLSEGDRASLVALCQQWSRYLEANRNVAGSGMVVRSPSGYPMPNPFIAIANKSLQMCVKLWAEFGLTPSSRTRVAAREDAPADDPFAEFDRPRLVKGAGV